MRLSGAQVGGAHRLQPGRFYLLVTGRMLVTGSIGKGGMLSALQDR